MYRARPAPVGTSLPYPPSVPRMVLLEHTQVDRSVHFDWLFARSERPDDDARDLVAFRISVRTDNAVTGGAGAFTGERLPDHRARYLWFEGDIGADRGAVRRVAAGRCSIHRDDPGEFHAAAEWDDGSRFEVHAAPVCGPPGSTDAWLLTLHPIA